MHTAPASVELHAYTLTSKAGSIAAALAALIAPITLVLVAAL
tara:strand:- start:38 stop:163 length:126 start_codon:yes stop_codon:yes gene_type:complete